MDERATGVPSAVRNHRRLGSAVIVVAMLVLSLVGCNKAEQPRRTATATTTSATPSPTTTPTPTPTPQPVVWPLTGQPATGPVDRPALAVKIENSVDARPQTGLNAADMVWEEVVEGGITRYVAVYQSTLPPTIGPVRSIRPMDPAIAGPLHGLMAFAGGIPDFVNAASAAGLQLLTMNNAQGFYRVSSRPAPHNLYASPQTLVNQADAAHRAAPPPQFLFDGTQPTAVGAGAPGGTLRLTLSPISHPSWTWSAPDNAWLRAEGGTPAVQADGARLRATNVVVLRVDVVMTGYTDAAGSHVPSTQLVGGGAALVATGGHAVAGTWSKSAVGAPVVLKGPDGSDIRLAPGNTWIELVPNATGAVATG